MTDLIHSIQMWLDKTGYPLEMSVASTMRQSGFEVRQASMYVEPGSEKARDIDVHAFKTNLLRSEVERDLH